MSQPEPESMPVTLNIRFTDASNLPILHVNALGINSSSDEFFFTLGVVMPPDQTQAAALKEAGYIVAQPIFRCAITRDTMEKFLALMASQYDEQTRTRKRLNIDSEETNEEEVSENE
jgi:hypothetical protein